MKKIFCCLFFATLLFSCGENKEVPTGYEGDITTTIQLNQVGFYPDQAVWFTLADPDGEYSGPPEFPVASPPLDPYYVTSLSGDSIVHEGYLGEEVDWGLLAGVMARPTEVGPLPEGEYRIYVPGAGYSYPFTVAGNVLEDAKLGSIKGLYYQRASQELPEQHAGKWKRPAGHPDTEGKYHPSSGHSEGKFSSPGGWYDAGDYNKYIVNGAFPLGQYLALYEDAGDPAPDGSLNIPESGNGKSDFLDELKYELDWMLTMQDTDGGLFHKFTTLNFEGMVMPHEATNQRYAVGKSSTATFDFAAATAQAARVYRTYDASYAERLLTASQRAWAWGIANPEVYFKNPENVVTGEYGDRNARDERAWAAAELFATTGAQEFLNELQANPPRIRFGGGGGWQSFMGNLASFTLLRFPDRVPQEMYNELRELVVTMADSLTMDVEKIAYRQPLTEFNWGSNSDVLNAAMTIAAANLYRPKPEYRAAMLHCTDYILGHNPNSVSYLTGFGDRTPMNIHHRQSAADGIDEPVPGLLSGGPNTGQQDADAVDYPAVTFPMRSWEDVTPSYASNEICLNWNAPLTYVLGYLEALPPAK